MFIDFDDTLFDRARFMREAFSSLPGVSADDLFALYADFRKTEEFTLDGFANFISSRGTDGSLVKNALLSFRDRADEYVFPDAKNFLGLLKQSDLELIILSRDVDPEGWQLPKIKASGLRDFFTDAVVVTGKKVEEAEKLAEGERFIFIDDKEGETKAMTDAFPQSFVIKHVPGAPLTDHLLTIARFLLPLPLGGSFPIGQLATDDGEVLTVTFGLSDSTIEKFIARSSDVSDEELMKFTSDHERFVKGSYADWYAKERYPFALLAASGALAGIIWFGPKELPRIAKENGYSGDDWDTFAIRMYLPYRGKRLAFPFSSFVIKANDAIRPGRKTWLDVAEENTGGVKLYGKLGFETVGKNDNGRMVMVKR